MPTVREILESIESELLLRQQFGETFLGGMDTVDRKKLKTLFNGIRIDEMDFINNIVHGCKEASHLLTNVPSKKQVLKELYFFESNPHLIHKEDRYNYLSSKINDDFIHQLKSSKIDPKEGSDTVKGELIWDQEAGDLPVLSVDDIDNLKKQVTRLISYYQTLEKYRSEHWTFNPRVFFSKNLILPYSIFNNFNESWHSLFIKLLLYRVCKKYPRSFFDRENSNSLNTIIDLITQNMSLPLDESTSSSTIRNNLRPKLKKYIEAQDAFYTLDQIQIKLGGASKDFEFMRKILVSNSDLFTPHDHLIITRHLSAWYHRQTLLPPNFLYSEF